MQGKPIRVFLLIETAFYRDGLSGAFQQVPSIGVVGQSPDWHTVAPLLREQRPDVVLLDINGDDRLAAIRSIGAALPHTRVVGLAVSDSNEDVIRLAEAGAAGYVSCSQSLDDLVAVIGSVARGELPCSPTVAASLMRRVGVLARARESRDSRDLLTAREREIVQLIGCGLSNREIGEHLVIELSTVKNHVHNILEKLQVSRRSDAVACLDARRGF